VHALQNKPQVGTGRRDEELVLTAADGDASAFEALVQRYAGLVLAVVERGVGDHHRALDLTQEVWIKVHRALGTFRADGIFRPWLFSIAFNHVRDDQRKAGRRPVTYLEEASPAGLPPELDDPNERHDERTQIEAALARVAEPYRSAIHLVDVMGLTYEEAGQTSSCAVGTMKSRVNRGRIAFRQAYLALGARGPRSLSRSRPHEM
jgi:RNA polymerase sigma-70 factor (ECF subfamily)